jgi:DNA-binding HxlR family transcriptional regulator
MGARPVVMASGACHYQNHSSLGVSIKLKGTIQGRVRPKADSVERTLSVVGDRWSFLIMREAFFGVRRFDAFLGQTGASPNMLADRLKKLTEHGLLERRPYQERPLRFEYRMTEKGRDLYPITLALMQWGDSWMAGEEGPPLKLVHTTCGQVMRPRMVCDVCGGAIDARDVDWTAS